jgi:PAS domain S-box-containing protein
MAPPLLDLNSRGALNERDGSLAEKMFSPPPAPPVDPLPAGPKANILMVDDTPENLVALEAVLGTLGQNLVKARSGEEALRLLLKHDFAVILLDVNMPGLSGFETAEMIRQRKSTEHIPIIFVSAISTSETHLFKGYSLGAVDYIFTPVIPEVLRSKVSVFVELLKKTEEVRHQADQLRKIEQREHRQRLSEAAQRLQLQTKQNRFFTLSVDLLAITDFQGLIKEANPAWQRVLGYDEAELKSCPFTSRMDQMEAWQALKAVEQAVRQQSPVQFEAQYPCKGGGDRCFSWTVAPYAAEQLLYLYGRDITETRRADREIKKLNSDLAQRAGQLQAANAELESEIATRKAAEQALQDSNSALETFSFSVSHDLRAPIRAMQGFAKVLLEDYSTVLDEMGRECANRIVLAAEKMDSLVHDLLIYSRLGHTTLHLAPVNVHEVALDVLGQLDQEIKNKNATVTIAEPLPVVQAHVLTLTQAVLNLVGNGLKFVPPGVAPLIKLSSENRNGSAVLWIEDNGIGIPIEHQARIFRVFERLHGAEQYPGTGLGLAIVRKAVERMGGETGVESEPGAGSRFWIKLPVARHTT